MALFVWLVILQLVLFGILIAFLRVVLTKNITKATTQISELNQDYSQKLEEAQKRVREADKYYDEMLLKSKTDAEKKKIQILKEASEGQQLMVDQSRKQSEEIIEKAQKSGESLLSELHLKISERAVQKACEIVQEILPELITRDMHNAWVEELSKHGLEELGRLNVAEEVRQAEIVTAYDLTPAQKTALEKKIAGKLVRELSFNIQTDPGLIAGLRISLGSVLIDGSLKFKIMEVARHA